MHDSMKTFNVFEKSGSLIKGFSETIKNQVK